jgi:hypothetical protein
VQPLFAAQHAVNLLAHAQRSPRDASVGGLFLYQVKLGASLVGTKRKCRNARVFPEPGVDRPCHRPVGHGRH